MPPQSGSDTAGPRKSGLAGTVRKPEAAIKDVARLAGVSPATVSRALNAPDTVKPATLKAVRQAIANTGYIGNMAAGGLASNRSRLVVIVAPMLANSIFADLLQAITDTLDRARYQAMIGLSGYDMARTEQVLTGLMSRRPEGIILAGAELSDASRERLRNFGIPVVETWELTPDPIDMNVGISHESIGWAIGGYLLAKGARRIALLSGGDRRAEQRMAAIRTVMSQAGMPPVVSITAPGVGSMHYGRIGMAQILDEGTLPEVVVCSQDALAQGAMAEAQSRNFSVPNDIAVMGFGDANFAAFTFPSLTTVRIDRDAMGRAAAEALLARMVPADKGMEDARRQRVIDIGFRIVERASFK